MVALGERIGSLHGPLGLAAALAVLLCFGLSVVQTAHFSRSKSVHSPTTSTLVSCGLATALMLLLFAATSGRLAVFEAGHRFLSDGLIANHQRLGTMAVWLVLAAVIASTAGLFRGPQRALTLSLWGAAAAATWLCTLGGSMLVGSQAPVRASARELANLSLRYHPNEVPLIAALHLVGGAFLLFLALGTWNSKSGGGPMSDRSHALCACFSVALGIALALWGTPDAWPSGEERPLSDAGVFGLRLYSLLLLLVGLAVASASHHRDRYRLRPQIWAAAALLGGVLLMTSEQTTAPYSPTAKWLYLMEQSVGAFVVLGAAVRLGCPPKLPESMRQLAWSGCLLIAGGLLVWSGGRLA